MAMNEPQVESETNPSAPAEWTEQIAGLRRQIALQLLALIVICGTLTVYLWYQSHITGKAIEALQPQAVQTVKALQQNRPTIDKLVRQLIVYGQSHPDFQPVLKKYGIPLTLSALTNSVPEK
jgi:hypothetical protein